MKCVCGNPIEQERANLNLKICKPCAFRRPDISRPKGIMVYGHKTAGDCQVVSAENFSDYRRLNPYGRFTGRGSGVHVVSPKAK